MIDNALDGVRILYRDHLSTKSKLNRLARCVATYHLHMKAAAGTNSNVKDGLGLMCHQTLHPSACYGAVLYTQVYIEIPRVLPAYY